MEGQIIEMISSVGFPIAACVYVAWLHHTSEERRIEAEERHSNERKGMTEAITKMNVTLDYIVNLISGKNKEQ